MTDPDIPNPEPAVKLCEHCMGEYVPAKSHQRFCCTPCQKAHHNAFKLLDAEPAQCVQCRATFTPKRQAQRFCRPICRIAHNAVFAGEKRRKRNERISHLSMPLTGLFDAAGNKIWSIEDGTPPPRREGKR